METLYYIPISRELICKKKNNMSTKVPFPSLHISFRLWHGHLEDTKNMTSQLILLKTKLRCREPLHDVFLKLTQVNRKTHSDPNTVDTWIWTSNFFHFQGIGRFRSIVILPATNSPHSQRVHPFNYDKCAPKHGVPSLFLWSKCLFSPHVALQLPKVLMHHYT